jgi:hypothetical protein
MTKITQVALHELLGSHLRLLESYDVDKDKFSAGLRASGYAGIIYKIADIVKVAILALENHDSSSGRITESAINISGVLELVLNLLPYEEAELLDILYRYYVEGSLLDGP